VGRRFPLLLYGGTIMLVTAIIAGSFLTKAQADGLPGWILGLIGILSL
jgi:cyclic beta-1,2-glucan synthetase